MIENGILSSSHSAVLLNTFNAAYKVGFYPEREKTLDLDKVPTPLSYNDSR